MTGIAIHPRTGEKMMTSDKAHEVAKAFREMGLFTSVAVQERGFQEGCFCVELWSVNATSGRRNLHVVSTPPASAKEYGVVARVATGNAKAADKRAYAVIAAQAAADRD